MSSPCNQYAFPSNDPTGEFAFAGMTLRDYFAAHSLNFFTPDSFMSLKQVAQEAYKLADAMLLERAV